MITVIYKIENIINSDCYIGSSNNYSRRKKRHFESLKQKIHHSIKLQRAYDKYGKEFFRIYELESFDFVSKELTLEREQHYIDLINPKYNICKVAGSQLGAKRSKEFREKCRQRSLGKQPWNKGIKTGSQTEETKLKRSNSLKGHVVSESTRRIISNKIKGRKFTEEHKKNLSKSKIKHGKYCRKK